MSANTNNWIPPVQFHFSVVFKLPGGDTAASFRSVSGIDQTLALQQQAQQGDNDLWHCYANRCRLFHSARSLHCVYSAQPNYSNR